MRTFIRSSVNGLSVCVPGGQKKRENMQLISVQLLSCVRLFVTLWTAARQTSLSITNSRRLRKLVSMDFWGSEKENMRLAPEFNGNPFCSLCFPAGLIVRLSVTERHSTLHNRPLRAHGLFLQNYLFGIGKGSISWFFVLLFIIYICIYLFKNKTWYKLDLACLPLKLL